MEWPLIVREHEKVMVLRDDLLPYGSKTRFLDGYFRKIVHDEVVYASPRHGFAQISIAYLAKVHRKRATIFIPASNEMTVYTQRAIELGANVIQVPMGFLSVLKSKVGKYAKQKGAFILPFGLGAPEVVACIGKIAETIDIEPDEVWTVAGSGTLSRGLQLAFPYADFFAVQTGRKLSQKDVGRATIIPCPIPFGKPTKKQPPFPSVPEYDAKAWEHIPKDGKKLRLFWNVGA